MKIHYWNDTTKCPNGNFGDSLNIWMWPRIIPDILEIPDRGVLVGIGTLLNHSMPDQKLAAIFGAGAGYGALPRQWNHWRFYCLRGPLTAQLFNKPEKAVTDAALLTRTCYQPKSTSSRTGKDIIFMPHWQTPQFPWKDACEQAGFVYTHPSENVEAILDRIAGATLVVTEAMHGAIIADAFRIPWIPISTRPSINSFKWRDWCGSLELNYQPIRLYWKRFTPNLVQPTSVMASVAVDITTRSLKRIGNSIKPTLSCDSILGERENALLKALDQLRHDVENGLFH